MKHSTRTFALAALLLAGLGGCADSLDTAGATSSGWQSPKTSESADASTGKPSGGYDAGSSASDIGSGWGSPADASASGPGGGPTSGSADQGIGLKPGGAQDIAFFRLKLQQGLLPKASDMTIGGWLNEHDTWLPKALKDRLVSLHAMAGVLALAQPGTATQSEAVVQLGLNSGKTLQDVTTEVALTVVIDRSGSMSGNKMSYVLAGLHVLADQLPKGTRIGVLSFSDDVKTVYAPQVTAAGSAELDSAIDTIQAGGGTNFYAGLQAGLEACTAAPAQYKLKRILMLSDGVPTVGTTALAPIAALAKQAAAAGCSVSSIGVGMDFSPALMNAVAQQGNGTAWFLQNAEHAKQVFVQDLETMLLPVAEKLWIQFQLAQGWKVEEIYGFDWVEQAGVVKITGPKSQPLPGEPDPQPDPDPSPDPGAEPVAMPTLFASQRNGLVMVRLSGPADLQPDTLADLTLATVDYGYSLAKDGGSEKFSVPVQVPGLTAIPDGGLLYFANPAVRRSWLLLHDGLDLIAACKAAEAGDLTAASAVVNAAIGRHDYHVAAMTADLPVYDATAPDLADARALLVALGKLLGK